MKNSIQNEAHEVSSDAAAKPAQQNCTHDAAQSTEEKQMKNEALIECVPNFSEGRNWSVIEAIHESIICDGNCRVLDYSADEDHNRSVFTITGSPEAVENAVLRFTKTAAEQINMETHKGVHPCIGATDVIPFVPLKNTAMDECITLSENVGKRIAEELKLPVYLYAKSAKMPSHKRLADIRRGGYTVLKEEISIIPERAPDFGPKYLTSAGGVSIGARDFLIAFNVYLDTNDVKPARLIAKKIRESSGGFPGLQAIGLLVKGYAQVSMNLLDYHKTSMKTIIQAIQHEADMLGVNPLFTELIGMLPKDALSGTNPKELLLKDFSADKILSF